MYKVKTSLRSTVVNLNASIKDIIMVSFLILESCSLLTYMNYLEKNSNSF